MKMLVEEHYWLIIPLSGESKLGRLSASTGITWTLP